MKTYARNCNVDSARKSFARQMPSDWHLAWIECRCVPFIGKPYRLRLLGIADQSGTTVVRQARQDRRGRTSWIQPQSCNWYPEAIVVRLVLESEVGVLTAPVTKPRKAI